MKFRKEDRAEFVRNVYIALLTRGEIATTDDPVKTADALKLHLDHFDAALAALKQPELLITSDDAITAGRKRRSSLGRNRTAIKL